MKIVFFFFFQAEDGIRGYKVTGVQTCALPICHLDQTLAVSPKRPNRANFGGWAEACTEQTHAVEILNPLTIGDIALPTWNVPYILRIDQVHFKTTAFKNLVKRNPVHSRGFHRHGADLAFGQPVGQSIQVLSERWEPAYRLRITVRRYRNKDLFCPDVDSRGIRSKYGQFYLAILAFLGHVDLL